MFINIVVELYRETRYYVAAPERQEGEIYLLQGGRQIRRDSMTTAVTTSLYIGGWGAQKSALTADNRRTMSKII